MIVDLSATINRGDIVSITVPHIGQIAVGIANYSSQDLALIKMERSDRIEPILGHHYGDEVVHRNNMVVL